jgi:DNA adenine methylase
MCTAFPYTAGRAMQEDLLAAPASPKDHGRKEARPFLKWAGGKGQLLEQLRPLFPAEQRTYHEPFLGGGAVFFDRRPRRAVLTDVNEELIECYVAVRDDVEAVIRALESHRYDEGHYYEVRSSVPRSIVERAARTIFLNRVGYNGLYRVNRSGQFNVPFGRYVNPTICDGDNLRACSRALAGVVLEVRSFERVVYEARPGDFVYFDPPYVPLSDTADFTSYAPGGFGWEEHVQLGDVFRRLAAKGVSVVLSNSDLPPVRSLYEGFHVETVRASRHINSKGQRRGKVNELVVTSYRPAARPSAAEA